MGALKIRKILFTAWVPGHFRMGHYSKSTGALAPVAPVPGIHIILNLHFQDSNFERFLDLYLTLP